MKRLILAATLAAMFSPVAQAHDFTREAAEFAAQLRAGAAELRSIQCERAGLDDLVTCESANAADNAAEVMEMLKPDDSNDQAVKIFRLANSITTGVIDNEALNQTMFKKLEGDEAKRQRLADALDNITHAEGRFGLATRYYEREEYTRKQGAK